MANAGDRNQDKFAKLKADGWHLCSNKVLTEIEDFDKLSIHSILEELKNSDLKNVGFPSFPEDASKAGKLEHIVGPLVTQVQKVRNVSAPKANEESQAAPRMLKLTLTDGVSSVNALETETINHISLNTPPGTKIQLLGCIPVRQGYLQIGSSNVKVLGGTVLKLVEKWEANRMVEMSGRVYTGQEGGPPPFVGFGKQRTSSSSQVDTSRPAFPSTGSGPETRKDAGSLEEKNSSTSTFEQQRDEALQEAMKAKAAEPKKNFGGSKAWAKPQLVPSNEITSLMVLPTHSPIPKSGDDDRNRQNSGNVSSRSNSRRDSDWSSSGGAGDAAIAGRSTHDESFRGGRGGGRGRGRGGGRGGYQRVESGGGDFGGGGDDGRPSGPATLFDFLETKISVKTDNAPRNEGKSSSKTADSSSLLSKSHPSAVGGQAANSKTQGTDSSDIFGAMESEKSKLDDSGVDLSVSHFPPPPTSANVITLIGTAPLLTSKKIPPSEKVLIPGNAPPRHQQQRLLREQQRREQIQRRMENNQNRDPTDDHGKLPEDAHTEEETKNGFHRNPEAPDDRVNGGGGRETKGESRDDDVSPLAKSNGDDVDKPLAPPTEKIAATRNDSAQCGSNEKRESVDDSRMVMRGPYQNRGPPHAGPMRPYPPSKLVPPPGHFPPHPPPSFRTPMGSPKVVGVGDAVLAKYWEDADFYVAVINQLGKNTVVVTFLEPYGNTEEVYWSDLMTFDGHPVVGGMGCRGGGGGGGPDLRMTGGRRRPNGAGDDARSSPRSNYPPPLVVNAMESTRMLPSRNVDQRPAPPKPKSSGPPRQFLLPDVHKPPPNFSGPPPAVSNNQVAAVSNASAQPILPKTREFLASSTGGEMASSVAGAPNSSRPPTMPLQVPPPPLLQPANMPPPISQPTPLLPISSDQEAKPEVGVFNQNPSSQPQPRATVSPPSRESQSQPLDLPPQPPTLQHTPPLALQQQPNQQQPATGGVIPPHSSVPPPPFNQSMLPASSSNLSPSMSIPPQTMMTTSYPPPPNLPHPSLQFTPPASMATMPAELAGSFMHGVPPGMAWMTAPSMGMEFYGANPTAVPLQPSPYNMTNLANSLQHPAAYPAAQHSFPVRVNAHHPGLMGPHTGGYPPPPGHSTTPTLAGAPMTSQSLSMQGAIPMEDYGGPTPPRLATAPMAPYRPQQMFQPLYPRVAQGNMATTAVFK